MAQLTESQIGIALGMHHSGATQCAIASQLQVTQSTISRLLRRHNISTFKQRGIRRYYRCKTTERADRRIVRTALASRRTTLRDLTKKLDLGVSHRTIQRRLKEAGIQKRIACTKPHLSPEHMAKRLEWAKERENWTVEQWGNVIWSDESAIQIGFDPRQTKVFRRVGEAQLPACLRPSFKSKRVTIMVWSCFRWGKLGPLIVCPPGGIGSNEYLEILADGLLSFRDDVLGSNWDEDTIIVRQPGDLLFMQDGAPCHKTRDVMDFLAEEDIPVIPWPAQSPDLNPIENLWAILKDRFHRRFSELRGTLSKSKDAMEWYGQVLQEVWAEIPWVIVSNLIRSYPGRIRKVIEANGGPIDY